MNWSSTSSMENLQKSSYGAYKCDEDPKLNCITNKILYSFQFFVGVSVHFRNVHE